MPNVVRKGPAAGKVYGRPFRGEVDHTAQIEVDLSGLTHREVDGYGYLKPGVPLTKAGALVGSGDKVFGVTIEPLNVLNFFPAGSPMADADLDTYLGALTTTALTQLAVGTIGQVVQKVCEDNLGASLTSDEVAGFAGTPLVLLS